MTTWDEWARGRRRWPALGVALVAACSFQNFDYLQESGEEPGEAGSSSGGSSGVAGSGGTAAEGGEDDTGGNAGTGAPTGGVSGSGSGAAGVGAGMGGTGDTGGMAGMSDTGGSAGTGGSGGSGGSGAVGELVNPSFETSNTSGWTVEPASALTSRYAYVQYPTGTVPAPDGSYELSTWHMTADFTVEIYQTVTGLEDGTYTFQGHFSRGDGFNDIYMFARNCGETDPDPLPIPLTDPSSFQIVALSGVEVTGGSCEVGIFVDSNLGNWMNADLFSLELE